VLIEHDLKAALPAVANCMVVGDKKKFLTCLFTIKVTHSTQLNQHTQREVMYVCM
jgi:hypothetical protein